MTGQVNPSNGCSNSFIPTRSVTDRGMAATTTVVLLSVASGVFWGIGPIFSKAGTERGGDANRATMIVLVVGSSGFLAASILRDGSSVVLGDVSPETLAVFALAGVLGTSFAWLLWFRGIDRIGASVSNIVFYTQPLFATVLAALVLGEELTVARTAANNGWV